MSGYCPDCGNTICICDEVNEYQKKIKEKSMEIQGIIKTLKSDSLKKCVCCKGQHIYGISVKWDNTSDNIKNILDTFLSAHKKILDEKKIKVTFEILD